MAFEPVAGTASALNADRAISVLRRYKWLILAVFATAVGAGIVVARFLQHQYEARATLWIQLDGGGQGGGRSGPIRSGELLNSSPAWIELFRSYRIVDEVAVKLSLFLQPAQASDRPLFNEFALGDRYVPGAYSLVIDGRNRRWVLLTAEGAEIERGTATDSVGRKAGFRWVVPQGAFARSSERSIAFHVATPRETSMQMLARLQHRLALGSNFLWVSYQDRDPQLAARTLTRG
jgi:uncharacterized protein involved in exopolysaccharide biosynthesis